MPNAEDKGLIIGIVEADFLSQQGSYLPIGEGDGFFSFGTAGLKGQLILG